MRVEYVIVSIVIALVVIVALMTILKGVIPGLSDTMAGLTKFLGI